MQQVKAYSSFRSKVLSYINSLGPGMQSKQLNMSKGMLKFSNDKWLAWNNRPSLSLLFPAVNECTVCRRSVNDMVLFHRACQFMHAEATVIALCSSKTKARCLCRQMMHRNWHTPITSHGILTFARTYNTLNGVGYKQEPMSCSSMQVACNFQPFHIAALVFFFFFSVLC